MSSSSVVTSLSYQSAVPKVTLLIFSFLHHRQRQQPNAPNKHGYACQNRKLCDGKSQRGRHMVWFLRGTQPELQPDKCNINIHFTFHSQSLSSIILQRSVQKTLLLACTCYCPCNMAARVFLLKGKHGVTEALSSFALHNKLLWRVSAQSSRRRADGRLDLLLSAGFPSALVDVLEGAF